MKSFRNPKYLERYEDVVFDLEQPLDISPNDTQYQKREVMKIVVDNTGETTPFDWYNSRLSIDFKVDKQEALWLYRWAFYTTGHPV